MVLSQNSPQQLLGQRVHAARLRKGWNLTQLAENAKVARTTLYQVERGAVSSPHAATLQRLAVALEVPVSHLNAEAGLLEPVQAAGVSPASGQDVCTGFDRQSHPQIDILFQRFPQIFSGFTQEDWGELCQSFDAAVNHSDENLLIAATEIARKRETLHRLAALLNSPLAGAATAIVNCLSGLPIVHAPPPQKNHS